ncbi:MAG: hypothetical protein AAGF12_18590 [Myxococcota bacterium]
MALLNSSGQFDSIPIERTQGFDWNELMRRGDVGGRLQRTLGDVQTAIYELDPDRHRAYLFQTAPAVGGDTSIYLAHPSVPSMTTAAIPTNNLRATRVYDIGACSYQLSWNTLTNILAAQLTLAVHGSPQADNITHRVTTVQPILDTEPRFPAILPLGSQNSADQIRVDTSFDADLSGCDNARIDMQIDITIGLQPGFNETAQTATADVLMQQVGCVWDSFGFDCMLPDGAGGVGPVNYNPGMYTPQQIDADIATMGCVVALSGTEYSCIIPITGSPGQVGVPYAGVGETFVRRPVDLVNGATNFRLESNIDSSDVDFRDCSPADTFARGTLARAIRGEVARLPGFVQEAIEGLVGRRATADFGIPAASVPSCASDTDCRVTPFLGGRRHSCDPSLGTCDFFRLEARRILIRPEGVEFVFAENSADPQFALLDGREGPLPGDPLFCDPLRYDPDRPDRTPPPDRVPGTIPIGVAPLLSATPMCNASAVGCTGICPDVGVACGLAGLVTTNPPPPLSLCNCHRCGLDVMTDPNNCGACGVVCASGTCVGGTCM